MENNKYSDEGAATSRQPRYPPGYRFMPTDRELILEYLAKKVKNEPIHVQEISVVNLYEHPPHYLAVNYPCLGNKEWYFFTPRDRKYPKGNRPSRSVEEVGYWKATGADARIHSAEGAVVGFKRTLVFHEFGGEGSDRKKIKTDWIMHEYRLNAPSRRPNNSTDMKLDDCVLCRIYAKGGKPYRTQMDVEEVRENNSIECLASAAEALNIVDVSNNYNSAINENCVGPFVNSGIECLAGQAEALSNNYNTVINEHYAGPFVNSGIECLAGQAEALSNNYNTVINEHYAGPFVNSGIECLAGQAEALSNNYNRVINEHYAGPFVDNNNLYNAGAIGQNHVDHGQYALNSGCPGHQYAATSYYPGQALHPDMSSHFQNRNLNDDIMPLQYTDDFPILRGNGLFEFDDYLGFLECDDYLIDHPRLAADDDHEVSTKLSEGSDDQHMRVKRRKDFDDEGS